MSVGYPLCNIGTQNGKHAEINADQATASDQPEVAERILDAFHDAGELFLLAAGYACAPNCQIHDLWDSEHANDHRDNVQAVPQIERSESIAQGTGLRVNADGREHKADAAR